MYISIPDLYNIFLESSSVSIDSRSILKNELFFALKGKKFDGNCFIEDVLNKGARAVITDNINFFSSFSNRIFYVKNTIYALQELASFHRNLWNFLVIVICGSNGKTTTKELISTILSKKYKILSTKGNLNNYIGLPLTLLKLSKVHKIAIIEMGASYLGEITRLCHIAKPDYGYITNFGKAHLEGFGSEKKVIQAKSELYDYLRFNKKKAFINADDNLQIQKSQGILRYFFSRKKNKGIYIKFLEDNYKGILLSFNKIFIQSNLRGIYNFTNLSAAITIANYFKISPQDIKIALENYYPNNNRSQFFKKKSLSIFLDAYNANPSSMEASISYFKRLKGSKTVILGSMLELGIYSNKEHKKIIKILQNTDILYFFLIGSHFLKTGIKEDRIKYFFNCHEIKKFLKIYSIRTDYLLIKGSRKLALERLIPFI